jgi:hypothetical protein
MKSRMMRWAENVTHIGRGISNVLAGQPALKRPLGRSRSRSDGNIKKISYRNIIGWCELDSFRPE